MRDSLLNLEDQETMIDMTIEEIETTEEEAYDIIEEIEIIVRIEEMIEIREIIEIIEITEEEVIEVQKEALEADLKSHLLNQN
jgi:hypothetical protein